jgi:hypothetical protein
MGCPVLNSSLGTVEGVAPEQTIPRLVALLPAFYKILCKFLLGRNDMRCPNGHTETASSILSDPIAETCRISGFLVLWRSPWWPLSFLAGLLAVPPKCFHSRHVTFSDKASPPMRLVVLLSFVHLCYTLCLTMSKRDDQHYCMQA